jgi:hypothetical protein
MTEPAPKHNRWYNMGTTRVEHEKTPHARNLHAEHTMRKPGLEPGRVAPRDPKSRASTNSATLAILSR